MNFVSFLYIDGIKWKLTAEIISLICLFRYRIIIFATDTIMTEEGFMRRIGRILCLLLLFLWQYSSMCSAEDRTLDSLLHRAIAAPSVDTYSAVCRFCYVNGNHADILSSYADSLHSLGLRTRSVRCFLEYYAWKSEAHFLQADYERGYALKRKAIALAERIGERRWLVESVSDLAYYFRFSTV